MKKYARVHEGAVVELISTTARQDINDLYHPDFVATLHEVGRDVELGWVYAEEKFSAPQPVEIPPPPPLNIPVDVFFERATELEAEKIEEAMFAKSVKIRRSYAAATSFKEGTDLWESLYEELVRLFGKTRSNELLYFAEA